MKLAALRRQVARHPKVRAVAGAVVDRLVAVVPGPPPGLRGRPPGVPESDVVTVVVAILDTDADTLSTTLDGLAGVARRHGCLRVVMAVEGEHLAVVRRAGAPAEHLLDRAAWERRGSLQARADYLRERLETIRQDLGAERVLVLPPGGTVGMEADLLLAGMPLPPSGRIGTWWRSRMLRLESALDAPSG